ncbi:MAG: hypothetical protein ACO3A2_08555 [Bdellovibrionia bacterium]
MVPLSSWAQLPGGQERKESRALEKKLFFEKMAYENQLKAWMMPKSRDPASAESLAEKLSETSQASSALQKLQSITQSPLAQKIYPILMRPDTFESLFVIQNHPEAKNLWVYELITVLLGFLIKVWLSAQIQWAIPRLIIRGLVNLGIILSTSVLAPYYLFGPPYLKIVRTFLEIGKVILNFLINQ